MMSGCVMVNARLCIMIRVVVELATGTVYFGLNTSPLDTILLPRLRLCRFTLLVIYIHHMSVHVNRCSSAFKKMNFYLSDLVYFHLHAWPTCSITIGKVSIRSKSSHPRFQTAEVRVLKRKRPFCSVFNNFLRYICVRWMKIQCLMQCGLNCEAVPTLQCIV